MYGWKKSGDARGVRVIGSDDKSLINLMGFQHLLEEGRIHHRLITDKKERGFKIHRQGRDSSADGRGHAFAPSIVGHDPDPKVREGRRDGLCFATQHRDHGLATRI